MKKKSPEQIFLHDFATPLSILKLHLRRLNKTLHLKDGNSDSEIQKKILNEMSNSLSVMEEIHANFKEYIHKKNAA